MALTAKKVYAILKRQISDMEAKLNSPVRYRGTVATADLLPLNPDIGDMYNIESKSVYGEAGMNVAWNGVVWDTMGAPIDMSLYIKSNELADWVKQQNKPTYTAEEVGALPDTTVIPSKTSDLQNDSGFLTKIPDNYLSGTDKTLSVSGQAADAKTVGDKNVELLVNILSKLDKNQGSENFGKIAGINEAGDIVPMFPVGVEYNEETNCLEFGSDQKMELNQGIGLDSTLTKTGSAADAGATGKEINSLKEDLGNKITKFYASNQGETHITDSDNGKIQNMMVYGKSSQDGTPTPDNPVEIKSVVNPTVKLSNEDGTKSQTVTLPYTLNAIPVESGGNVTIDGQQYIADYVDVERGKVIRNILKWYLADVKTSFNNTVWHINISKLGIDGSKIGLSNMFKIQNSDYAKPTISELYISDNGKTASLSMRGMTDEEFKKWLIEKNPEVYNVLTVAEEIPITLEEASVFKQLMTYYPVTNVSVNSEQLDGYTVFNYPISMANGWNYVKKQLNDNRDYIYDMDARTQDIDTQAAEAYVNSEYAVALTELEV